MKMVKVQYTEHNRLHTETATPNATMLTCTTLSNLRYSWHSGNVHEQQNNPVLCSSLGE